jgi:hypothetical protein
LKSTSLEEALDCSHQIRVVFLGRDWSITRNHVIWRVLLEVPKSLGATDDTLKR